LVVEVVVVGSLVLEVQVLVVVPVVVHRATQSLLGMWQTIRERGQRIKVSTVVVGSLTTLLQPKVVVVVVLVQLVLMLIQVRAV
jgi:hypothetical protein